MLGDDAAAQGWFYFGQRAGVREQSATWTWTLITWYRPNKAKGVLNFYEWKTLFVTLCNFHTVVVFNVNVGVNFG
jgi:hypothetical protein